MEEYPKLLAIGWAPTSLSKEGTLIYLLEDEDLFYGYAQNPNFYPRVKPGWTDLLALRWGRGLALPKGDEDVHKLYHEAIDIIRGNNKLMYMWQDQKSKSESHGGKQHKINIKYHVKRTLADPVLSKYFL
jgi:hypothetical protein